MYQNLFAIVIATSTLVYNQQFANVRVRIYEQNDSTRYEVHTAGKDSIVCFRKFMVPKEHRISINKAVNNKH